jgi:hypothetical protein
LDDASRERLKRASRELLASIKARPAGLDRFWEKEQTKVEVEVLITDKVYASPPFYRRGKEAHRGQHLCPRLAAGHAPRVRETVKGSTNLQLYGSVFNVFDER